MSSSLIRKLYDYLDRLARYDTELDINLDIVLRDEEAEKIFEDLLEASIKRLNSLLKKAGVNVRKLKPSSYVSLAEYVLRAIFNEKGPPKAKDVWMIVYGDSMGFEYENGKWRVFEGSDDPTDLDMYLYTKLILGQERGSLKLYGTHGDLFIEDWFKHGIPKNTYFTSKKQIAQRYWHPDGYDHLVEVKIPRDAVIETAEYEYKTIRTVEPNEFKLRYIG